MVLSADDVLGEVAKSYLSLEQPCKGQNQSMTDSLLISQSERHTINQSETRQSESQPESQLVSQRVSLSANQWASQSAIQPARLLASHLVTQSTSQPVS